MSQTSRRAGILNAIVAALFSGVLVRLQHGAEVERATDALTAEAGRKINLQYETADGRDVKTLGMIAASIAAAAFVASAQHDWKSLLGIPTWGLPLVFLGIYVVCFVMSLWTQPFQRGPRVPKMYREAGLTMIEVKGQILRELVEALEHNRRLLGPKGRWYAAGAWSLFVSVVSTAIVLLVQHV